MLLSWVSNCAWGKVFIWLRFPNGKQSAKWHFETPLTFMHPLHFLSHPVRAFCNLFFNCNSVFFLNSPHTRVFPHSFPFSFISCPNEQAFPTVWKHRKKPQLVCFPPKRHDSWSSCVAWKRHCIASYLKEKSLSRKVSQKAFVTLTMKAKNALG